MISYPFSMETFESADFKEISHETLDRARPFNH